MKMHRIAVAVTSAFGLMSMAGVSLAADPADATTEAPQKVYVTGSAVKHIEGETSLPVQVITREDIDRTGAQTTAELLNAISAASSSGNNNPASNITGTNMMNAVSLRGMGYQRTLVLLNGRRVANNAMDGGGVDLDTIPLSALERVEVLEDGASAVYGADAVGGVINFILKKDYQGVEGTLFGSGTQHGGAATARATLTMGFGDLAEDNFNAFVTMTAGHDNSLNYSSRPQLATVLLPASYGSGRYFNMYGAASPGNAYSQDGTIVGNPSDPNCTAKNQYPAGDGTCLYDYGSYGQILPTTDRYSLVSRMTFRANNETEFFVETSLARNTYVFGNYPTFADGYNTVADGTFPGDTPFLVYPGQQYYPNQWANSNGLTGQPIAFESFINELGPSRAEAVNDQYRLVTGVNGVINGWDYDTAINLNHAYTGSYFLSGVLDTQKFYNLTLAGLYNPFGPQSPASLAALQATQFAGQLARANANVQDWDLKLSRSLFSLPGGSVDVALGTELRRETLNQVYSPEWALGELLNYGGSGGPPNPAPRMVKSLSAEADFPILKTLETDVSVRDDHYSTFGNTVNPKVSFRWQPVKTVMFRGSWGTGFRAPSLTDTSTPATYGNASSNYYDPILCPNGNPVAGANPQVDCGQAPYLQRTGGNPNLQPEKSRQSTLGVVFEPTRSFSAGVNYFHIHLTNVIQLSGLPANLAFDPATAAQYSFMLVRYPSNPATPNLPGSIEYINTPSINEGAWDVRGADLNAEYTFPESDLGKFAVKTNGTYNQKFDITMAGLGTTGTVGEDYGGVINRWHQYLALNWSKNEWDVTFDSTYWSGYQDASPYSLYGLSTPGYPQVPSYTLFDMTAIYKVSKNLTVSAGIKNMFDRLPPYSNHYPNGWNSALADPRLRSGFASVTYQFK